MKKQDTPATLSAMLIRLKDVKDKGITFIGRGNQEEFLSYGQLYADALSWMHYLQEQGLHSGDELVLQVEDNKTFLQIFWACILSAIVPVPASVAYHTENVTKLTRISAFLNHPFLVTNRPHYEKLCGQKNTDRNFEEHFDRVLFTEDMKHAGREGKIYPVTADMIAFLQFSSGSTGDPKGVTLTHANVIANIRGSLLTNGWNEKDSTLSWMPLTHDMGLICFHLYPLYIGIQQYIMPTDLFIRAPLVWLQKISTHRVTITGSPNFGYKYYLNQFSEHKASDLDLSCLRIINNGAEPISAALCRRFTDTMKRCGLHPDAIRTGYGLAEATLKVTFKRSFPLLKTILVNRKMLTLGNCVITHDSVQPMPSESTLELVNVGEPITGMDIRIYDEQDNILPEGYMGLIRVKGDSVTRKYYNNAAATDASISKDGWLNTGDTGFMWEGCLYVAGRVKDIIFVNGANVYPHDIENTLEQLEGIDTGKVVACGIPDKETGVEAIVIFVVHKASVEAFIPLADAIKGFIAARLGLEIKQVVPVRKIPKTTSGKVKRYLLAESFVKGAYTTIINTIEEVHRGTDKVSPLSAPSTPSKDTIEQWLCEWLQQRFNLTATDLVVDKPFSAYGMTSMHVVVLAADLEVLLGTTVEKTIIYNFPTPATLSAYLSGIGNDAKKESELRHSEGDDNDSIAIVGIGCRFPGDINTPEAFWTFLKEQRSAITVTPEDRWDVAAYSATEEITSGKMYTQHGGFLRQVDKFDPMFFGISPKEAAYMDPQQRLLLEICWEALEHGGFSALKLRGSDSGIFIGMGSDDYETIIHDNREHSFGEDMDSLGVERSIAAGRIAYTFDFHGPVMQLDTACSSSLLCIHQARLSLIRRECSLALAGGVNLMLTPDTTVKLCQMKALSPTGLCKSFDDSADGYVRGEGCGIVVMKRLRDALADGDNILAVIKGSAVNHDGLSNGLTAPNGTMQQQLIEKALRDASVGADTVQYVETHGTGTRLGDPVEVQALQAVYGDASTKDKPLLIGAVKSNIGHLEAAGGVAGFIKTVLCLQHGEIPASLHYEVPNKFIPWNEMAVKVVDRLVDWPVAVKRRAAVSAFGLSGTNVHVIVEQAPDVSNGVEAQQRQVVYPSYPLLLSAKTPAALEALAQQYIRFCNNNSADWRDIAYSAAITRDVFQHRLALQATSKQAAGKYLLDYVNGITNEIRSGVAQASKGKLVWLFTGQGIENWNTGKELYEHNPVFKNVIDQCDAFLKTRWNIQLVKIFYETDGAERDKILQQTMFAQPAVFAISCGLAAVLKSWGVSPSVVVGHGIGEYAAACIAGVFSLEDGLILIAARAQLTQSIKERGTTHSAPMEPMLDEFREVAAGIKFHQPVIDLISSVTGMLANPTIASPDYWCEHITAPVQFYRSLTTITEQGGDMLMELGPHPALLPLAQMTLEYPEDSLLTSLEHGVSSWSTMLQSLMALHVKGISVNWEEFYAECLCQKVTLPVYPFQRQRYWIQQVENTQVAITSPVKIKEITDTRDQTADSRMDTLAYLRGALGELLKIPAAEIDIHRDILLLGANSLTLIRMVTSIEKKYKVKFTIPQLFEALTTLDKLATYIEAHKTVQTTPEKTDPIPATSDVIQAPAAASDLNSVVTVVSAVIQEQMENMRQQILVSMTQQFKLLALQLDSVRSVPGAIETVASGEMKNIPENGHHPMEERNPKDEIFSSESSLSPITWQQSRPLHIPLSFEQESLWFIDQLEGSVAYHEYLLYRVEGVIQVPALRYALRQIVNRHEVLRTVYTFEDETLFQKVLAADQWELEINDRTFYEMHSQTLETYLIKLVSTPFDLSKDYMLRAQLIHLSEMEHMLVLTIHHIASDGWSVDILYRELVEFYTAYMESRTPQLPSLNMQYADYAIWQRESLSEEVLNNKMVYWKNKLEGVIPLNLLTDHPRPAVPGIQGAAFTYNIDLELTDGLRNLGKQHGATLYMTLLSVFNVLLYRYSGQGDICIGTSVVTRMKEGVEELIGYFVNTLAIRNELKNDILFTQLLKQVRQTTLDAFEHHDVPFAKVVDQIITKRDLGRNPLFQVRFELHEQPDISVFELGGVRLSREMLTYTAAKFDLMFSLYETKAGLYGSVEYDKDLFDEDTIVQLCQHFKLLLYAVVKSPEEQIGRLSMLSPKEQEQLLISFNNVSGELPANRTMMDLFMAQVYRTPDAVAVMFEDQQLTYSELAASADQLAHYLRAKGVREETMVPICIEKSLNMIIGILGILKAGAAYVPIDSEHPIDRIRHILEDTGANIIVADTATKSLFAFIEETSNIILLDADKHIFSKHPATTPEVFVTPSHLAYVIYTSGSTGQPKGVMVEHGGMLNHLQSKIATLSVTSDTTIAFTAAYTFDISVWQMFASLLKGGKTIIYHESLILQPALFLDALILDRITILELVPSYLAVLLREKKLTLLKDLCFLIVTGEAVSYHLLELWFKCHTERVIPVANAYGPTEASDNICHYAMYELPERVNVPLGQPIQNMKIYILDESLQLCPVGVGGEICVTGIGVSRGYLNRPSLTAERFIKDPFYPESTMRMYRTGDRGRWLSEGVIEYLGRFDDQVKIHGYRIEPGEIESALQASGMVNEAVVIARQDHLTNNNNNSNLIAYVVPQEKFDKAAVLSYLKMRLPGYMIPTLLIEIDKLPLTDNGKIDKKALPDPGEMASVRNKHVPPGNELERLLIGAWEQILGISGVGIYDNFFESGGHSLLGTMLISVLRRQLKVELTIKTLFNFPTVAKLATYIESQQLPVKHRRIII
ncbi:non-ribosomal peptide synthetase/type I polyketide synthase [Chitinophaga sp. HK235]|uniref:non-ribosomal peptide synthetase/type I polyketide synthase n=1 Tax=Chitinophaga sp. HK235 TaxID=2952571 RepID=UPI001BA8AF52|nr:non-ribosomal peptide synthetase/type I polyketide synthase [Chitinophaga sp. HK235]